MAHQLIGGAVSREFLGMGMWSLSQFRHCENVYTYVMRCEHRMTHAQMRTLKERCDMMNIQFEEWRKYVGN
jgi:hypothetical protein